jgi:hypothetical protein
VKILDSGDSLIVSKKRIGTVYPTDRSLLASLGATKNIIALRSFTSSR